MGNVFASTRRMVKIAAAAALVAASVVSAHAASFDVYARENSTADSSNDIIPLAAALNTGIFFNVGDTLSITASGLWNGGGCGDVSANGTTCFGNAGAPQTSGINYFSLAGRLGDGNYFKIGESFSGVAASSGVLYLAFVDKDAANNSGFVTAVVGAVPEPETYALMLAGLTLVVAVGRRKKRSAAAAAA